MRLRDLFRRPRPAILMYHRVERLAHDPWELAVSPDNFDAQMAFLASERLPLRMSEFVERQRRGTLKARHVAVTFDDAYLDNLVHARPALLRHGVPATVFAVSDRLGEGGAFWWDEWARLALEAPVAMDLSLRLGDTALRLRWDAAPARQTWRAWMAPACPRERAYVEHYALLQQASPQTRRSVLDQIGAVTGDVRIAYERSMTFEELREHMAGGLVELGSHTRTHPPLAHCNVSEALEEIGASRRALMQAFDLPVSGFAYPYGSFNAFTPGAVETSGYEWACATTARLVGPDAPIFALPRIAVGDWEVGRLRRALSA